MSQSKNARRIVYPDTVWEDIQVDSSRVTVTGPSSLTWTTIAYAGVGGGYAFENRSQAFDEIAFNIQMSHSVSTTSRFLPHIHWCPVTGAGGTVVWELGYAAQRVHGGSWSPFTSSTVSVRSSTTAYFHDLTDFAELVESAAIEMRNPSACLTMRMRRLEGTYAGLAVLLYFDVHYQREREGTTTPAPPWDT
jgi:hypothetical protein